MEYYSAIKNNKFMKFLGKWVELENVILSVATQSQKNIHGMHSLKLRIPKKQFTYQTMPKNKEGGAPDPGKA